jgi:hypothetical protein
MTYAEVMTRTSADFWAMLWPLYLLIAAWVFGAFAKWIAPK